MIMIDPLLPLVVSTSLALLFFMAARHKMSDRLRFQAQLGAYCLVPDAMLPATSRTLPWLEMALVFLLLIPATRAPAAAGAAALLAVYALAMAINIRRGRREIDCGCGGEPQTLSVVLLGRNVVLIVGALLLMLPVSERMITAVDIGVVALLTATFAMSYLMTEQLIRNNAVLTKFEQQE